MSAIENPSNKLQDHLLTLQKLLDQSELSLGLDHQVEEEMLSQIEALSDSIEQPSIYTIDDSNTPAIDDSNTDDSNEDSISVDRELPILMDKIELEDARANKNTQNVQASQYSQSQPGYETSSDLADNILDALAEIDPYVTLPVKGSNDYEKLSAALAKRLEIGFKKPN